MITGKEEKEMGDALGYKHAMIMKYPENSKA